MSYLKHIATITAFLQENDMENPIVPEVIPSYQLLQDLREQAYTLIQKRESEQEQIPAERKAEFKAYYDKTIAYIKADFCDPVSQLLDIFYNGDIFGRKLFIEAYRSKNGLTPLFDTFPTQDRLTGAISHAFDMAKAAYGVYEQFRSECGARMQVHGENAWTPEEREKARLMREHFEYTHTYAYRMLDVLESTYMS
jgi:hypothetical protein